MEHSHEEIRRQVKIYVCVFVALAFLTVVTVAVSYLKLPLHQAILVALAIATVKGSLVVMFFMHLISEKQIIFWILILTVLMVVPLFFLPVLSI